MGKKADYPEFDLRDVYESNSKNAFDIITVVMSLPFVDEQISKNFFELIGYEKGFFGKKLAVTLKIEWIDDIITDPLEDAKISEEIGEELPDWHNRFLGVHIISKYDTYSLQLCSCRYSNPVYFGKDRKFIASYGYLKMYAGIMYEVWVELRLQNERYVHEGFMQALTTRNILDKWTVLNKLSPVED